MDQNKRVTIFYGLLRKTSWVTIVVIVQKETKGNKNADQDLWIDYWEFL